MNSKGGDYFADSTEGQGVRLTYLTTVILQRNHSLQDSSAVPLNLGGIIPPAVARRHHP